MKQKEHQFRFSSCRPKTSKKRSLLNFPDTNFRRVDCKLNYIDPGFNSRIFTRKYISHGAITELHFASKPRREKSKETQLFQLRDIQTQ